SFPFGSVSLRFCVAQRQGRDSAWIALPELEEHIAPDGNPRKGRTTYFSVIEDAGDIRRVLFQSGRTLANAGVAVPAQVGQNHTVARDQRLCRGQPQFMMCRKRMEQNDRWAISQDLVRDFSVTAGDLDHRRDLSR